MKVLVLGATGYIGSAVTAKLLAAGHEPIALVRPSSRKPDEIESRSGDFGDPASLVVAVTPDIDAVVVAVSPSGDWTADKKSVEALLAPAPKVLYISGIWVFGATGDEGVDEQSPVHPLPISAGRPAIEQAVLAAGGIVVRPGVVYGHNGGIPEQFVGIARATGHGRYVVGAEVPRWPLVHVEDVADLIVLALEQGNGIYHASGEVGVDVRAIAEATDRAAGGSGVAEPWPLADAAETLGALYATALSTDQVFKSPAARELGWEPVHTDAVGSIAKG